MTIKADERLEYQTLEDCLTLALQVWATLRSQRHATEKGQARLCLRLNYLLSVHPSTPAWRCSQLMLERDNLSRLLGLNLAPGPSLSQRLEQSRSQE